MKSGQTGLVPGLWSCFEQLKQLFYSVCLLAICAGCGYSPDLPPMAEVTGVVRLDGQPLPRGKVQFSPEAQGPLAVGDIDSQGKFTLTTQNVEGAVLGRHTVGITSAQLPKNEMDTLPASLIPAKYNNPASSGLVYEVKKDEANHFEIELSSKP